jgi:hypothetical protein
MWRSLLTVAPLLLIERTVSFVRERDLNECAEYYNKIVVHYNIPRWRIDMKKLTTLLFVLFFPLLLSSCSSVENHSLSENQALKVIIFKGTNYRVTEEAVDMKYIQQKVGQVNSYSNQRGEHNIVDAFSNVFPVGTELYKIKDADINLSIAVKKDSLYLRALKR